MGAPGMGRGAGGNEKACMPRPCLRTAPPPPSPRHRSATSPPPAPPRLALRSLACLTLAAGGKRCYAFENGGRGAASPHHALLGCGAGGLCEGGACMPGPGMLSKAPACPSAATPGSRQPSMRRCTAQPAGTAAANTPFRSPFRPPPGPDPRNDFTAHCRHLTFHPPQQGAPKLSGSVEMRADGRSAR